MSDSQTVKTICSFCGTGCGLLVTTENGKIVKVTGDKEAPASRGETCVKGIQGWGYAQSKNRLTTPLVRKNGQLVPTSWDEALSVVADAITRVKQTHGGEAFGCFSSSRATNELNYLAQKMTRQIFSSNNVDSCNRT